MRNTNALFDFLIARFDDGELRRFVSLNYPELSARLPGDYTSQAELVMTLVNILEREGCIDPRLFILLRRERPRFADAIARIEQAYLLDAKARAAAPVAAGSGSAWPIPASAPGDADPLKIVFLTANPVEMPELDLREEAKQIEDKLRPTPSASRFRFTWFWRASPDDLIDLFFEPGPPPAVLHFSGHGGPNGELLLEARGGAAHPVDPEALAGLIAARPEKSRPRLVVLNACYSAAAAKAMVQHVDAVVGMRSAVVDVVAQRFAVQFYRALAHRDSLQTAIDTARAALRVFNLPGDDLPQLSVRGDRDPRTYVLL